MAKRGLSLSPEKTVITHIDFGFDFLGQNVRKYGGKLLIKPSQKNLKTFLGKIKTIVNGNKTVPQWALIRLLNPVIQGWARYHRHVVAKDTFHYADHRIWQMLWQWSRRRHLNRSKRWVKQKYFKTLATRSWVFSATDPDGNILTLFSASAMPIKRHVKIRADANPYDPSQEMYFEQRLDYVWKNSKRGKLLALWKHQLGRCPLCEQHITQVTGWHVHHVHQRHKGGSDELDNLVLLHPNCHRQLHNSSEADSLKTEGLSEA